MIPNYLEHLRKEFPKKTDLQLEHLCVRSRYLQDFTGATEHEHRMNAMRLMWPKRIVHAWREKAMESFYRCKVQKKKELLWLGSSNSNKTGGMADLLVELWMENPEATSIYITSPYEDATETGIWARVVEQFDAAKALHDHLPGRVKESDSAIVMFDRNPLSFIKVVTVDQVGKLVGKKSSNFEAGMMIIACDELPEFKRGGEALISVLKNIRSVPNFMLIGAGNFADVNDGLGRLAEPAREGGYESLNVDLDHEWETARGGLAIRFDGHQSPNVLAGKDIIPVVTTIANLKDLEMIEGGTNTPGYYRYGRSFPMLDFNEYTVTNAVKLRAGGAFEKADWSSDDLTYGAHCDPGFGGDPCVIAFWRFGQGFDDGERKMIFELCEVPVTIPINVGAKDAVDREETVDAQIARKCKEHLDKRKIPYGHFSFDDSMRGGIVQAMMRAMGNSVVAISSAGVASRRILSAVKQTVDPSAKPQERKVRRANDEYQNAATEMHFAVSALVDARQFRGLHLSKEAVRQLCTRKWRWIGKKKQIEIKFDFKAHSSGKSPNESDAIVGGVENARRLGLVFEAISSKEGGAVALLLAMRRQQELKALMQSVDRPALPPGRLHSMGALKSPNRGRLHNS